MTDLNSAHYELSNDISHGPIATTLKNLTWKFPGKSGIFFEKRDSGKQTNFTIVFSTLDLGPMGSNIKRPTSNSHAA
jgi:hypothetical protein